MVDLRLSTTPPEQELTAQLSAFFETPSVALGELDDFPDPPPAVYFSCCPTADPDYPLGLSLHRTPWASNHWQGPMLELGRQLSRAFRCRVVGCGQNYAVPADRPFWWILFDRGAAHLAEDPEGALQIVQRLPEDFIDNWFIGSRETGTSEETHALGREIGSALEGGELITLRGDLGSGKTHLTKGIAEGLDVPSARRHVNSPTFVLHNQYEGRLLLHHSDAYRLHNADHFHDLGLLEQLDPQSVLVVEWAERVSDALPAPDLAIRLFHAGPTQRLFQWWGQVAL